MNLESLSDDELLAMRKELVNKVSKYNIRQHSAKISLNSLYGAMGTPYFRYYDVRIAEAVTYTGQYLIKWLDQGINRNINTLVDGNQDRVIGLDTDSNYLTLKDVVEKFLGLDADKTKVVNFLDKMAKNVLEPEIEKLCQQASDYLHAAENRIVMKREVIADRGIWKKKKNYVLNVLDEEGVRFETAKLKVAGLSAVKSSTPSSCRKALKEAFQIIFQGTERDLQKFVSRFRKEFMELDLDVIASTSSCNGLTKYSRRVGIYGPKTPIHVRGSLLYNHYLKEKKLTKRYNLIRDGDKVKYIFLELPNPWRENVIAFPDNTLPKEFGLHKYIDRRTQFDKVFLKDVAAICDLIGWSTERKVTLFG